MRFAYTAPGYRDWEKYRKSDDFQREAWLNMRPTTARPLEQNGLDGGRFVEQVLYAGLGSAGLRGVTLKIV